MFLITIRFQLIYRLDAKTPLGFAWLLISWIPDSATIRQKMLYASTKATLKTEFGSAHITEEIHATDIVRTKTCVLKIGAKLLNGISFAFCRTKLHLPATTNISPYLRHQRH